ncbi:hypothetical protein [Levilactobacillus namurensis]|uniref:hypothetical protein n=1 Tax=Levilactobacillus namurensis TaxID=380393 RepID=UPI00222FAEDD|nr:hypothetical protein [Levilactobacillus namurensis]MCW3777891.1 hypothetical protein [Levilactobacillus namurensis]MDT7018240.1 hypothetical protein [Levilactobacillus namurensis]WNN64773.1 hypothetical protein RIN67_08615 [Levilactobacillus namurensis]
MSNTFTVKEMIDYLAQFEPDTQVLVRSDEYNDMGNNSEINKNSFEIPGDGSIVIRC